MVTAFRLFMYNNKFNPLKITGIDLSKANIEIANYERENAKVNNVRFLVDDAQNLTHIPSNSVDVLLNIESAFHYPDKPAFLKEVNRVLKPGGQFLVADILSTREKSEGIMKIWGKPMIHHFWNRKRYDEEFQKSELVINHREDITHQVRKGWSIYRNWIPELKRKSFLMNVAFRIFYVINVRLNMYFCITDNNILYLLDINLLHILNQLYMIIIKNNYSLLNRVVPC